MPKHDDCDTEVSILTVDDVLSHEDCARLIAQVDSGRWHPSAEINDDIPLVTSGPDSSDGGRDQEALARFSDPRLALRLYMRTLDHLPDHRGGRELFGLKPEMNCLRYERGHRSDLHEDRAYAGEADERSELTLLIYLNSDFVGGDTEFPDQALRVSPQAGRAVVFPHGTIHRGNAVQAGTKYVLRTEVYYTPLAGRVG